MNHQSPNLKIDITVTNLPEYEDTTSTIVMKVERIVNEYYSSPNRPQPFLSPLTTTYHYHPTQLSHFTIDSSFDYPEICQILREKYDLTAPLSIQVASQIICKAGHMYLGLNAIVMSVNVKISYNTVFDVSVLDIWASEEDERLDEEDEEDMVAKLVSDCVVSESLGLENESCSICLENLLEVSEKVPTRMLCSHLFHDCCILRWLYLTNSCPVCRRVILER